MQDLNFKNWAFFSSVMIGLALGSVGCSTGSDSATGTGGTTGSGGTSTTGSGGSTTGGGTGTGGTGMGTGTGGTGMGTGTGGSMVPAGPSVCDGTATRILTMDQVKVDNFEDATISAGWSTFNDVMPTPDSFKMMKEAGGAAGTASAARYAGMGAKTPLMMGYGVGAIYNAAIDKAAGFYCIDVQAFDGVTFWAKAAMAGSKVAVNFVVPETNAKMYDGDCLSGCFRHPSKTFTLTTEWQQYSVTFADASGGTAKVRGKLQLLGWLSPDSNWDFSLDEIQFYKGMPPTGPVPTTP
jgi:hypothetical protein